VGAGASSECRLPVGTGLAEKISYLLDFEFEQYGFGDLKKGDQSILNALKINSNKDNELYQDYQRAAIQISNGIMAVDSIDNYLDIHNDDENVVFCGKVAIVRAILEAEEKSDLYYDYIYANPKMINFKKSNQAWLKKFFSQLTRNRPKSDLQNIFNGITIISFNYDRCIEQYIFHALQNVYSISDIEAFDLLKSLEIYHPYGMVGELKTNINQKGVPFGGKLSPQELIKAAEGIRTYTEQVKDKNSLDKIKDTMEGAEVVVFLGFAYHQQNIKILSPLKKGRFKSVFGTALNVSDPDVEEVKKMGQRLSRDLLNKLEIRNKLTCSDLFTEYQMSL